MRPNQIVTQKGAVLPTELAHHEQSTVDRLQKYNGKDFDKTYAKDMVRDHEKDLKEFQDAAKDLNDPDLKAFVQKTIPILEQHLNLARNVEGAVKNEK